MPANFNETLTAVIATADDGSSYLIERRRRTLPGGKGRVFFFCCLPNGEVVGWLGYGQYEMPDGTIVRVRGCSRRRLDRL